VWVLVFRKVARIGCCEVGASDGVPKLIVDNPIPPQSKLEDDARLI
jgi:hypothetical protein